MDNSNLRQILAADGGKYYYWSTYGNEAAVIRYYGPTQDSYFDFTAYDDACHYRYWPAVDGMHPDSGGVGYTFLPDTVETRFAKWMVQTGDDFFDVREMSDDLLALLHGVEDHPEDDMRFWVLCDYLRDQGVSVSARQQYDFFEQGVTCTT